MNQSIEQTVYVAGTFDTKGRELGYLAHCLKNVAVKVLTVNLGTQNSSLGSVVDFSAEDVACFHPDGAECVMGQRDRGNAISAMAVAFQHFLGKQENVAGVIGAGGSGGTALLAPAFQSLPIGIPKLIVSTVASGNVAPYVGASDITMMYSVTDVEGLNRISRKILGNAAHAMAGMATHAPSISTQAERPAVGLTMFGVTTECIKTVSAELDTEYDCLVFHATGTGGRSMERLVDSHLLNAVVDITTTEIADLLVGGVFAANEDRLGAVIRTACPYIGSVGALDMVNFGARETVPEQFSERLFHVHNSFVTLMRTSVDENIAMAQWIAKKLNQMQGEVRFLLPEKGVSLLDAEGMPFFDPAADAALFETLEATVEQTPKRRLIRVPAAINDSLFSDAVIAQCREVISA